MISIVVHLRQPIVTGTSVLGIKFKDGVMMAADNLGVFEFFYTINRF
jgi:20S proteasome alpha/beta subunit